MRDNCFLCESNQYHIIHYGTRNVPSINVFKCDNCGLVRLSESVDEQYYIDSGMRRKDSEKNIREIRNVAFKDDQRRFNWLRGIIENKNYLDFGCGAGGVLKLANDVTEEAYGVELESSIREILNEEGLCCFDNIDSAVEKIKGKIDVISMFHVLEHLPDPINILDKMKSLLKPGGCIVIEIPNADDALLSLFACKEFEDFTYWESHIYLYNNKTFEILMEKSGFRIKFLNQIQRYPLSNTLFWLAQGKPGGHKEWNMLSNEKLDKEYENQLARLGIADTIIAIVEPK